MIETEHPWEKAVAASVGAAVHVGWNQAIKTVLTVLDASEVPTEVRLAVENLIKKAS